MLQPVSYQPQFEIYATLIERLLLLWLVSQPFDVNIRAPRPILLLLLLLLRFYVLTIHIPLLCEQKQSRETDLNVICGDRKRRINISCINFTV